MKGLYALKPWYAARLAGLRRVLVAHGVSPDALTWSGVLFGAAAGGAVALLPAGPFAGAAVAVLLAARLACANLDGGVARDSGRMTRNGAVRNELGDRLAEFAVLAGCLAVAPAGWVLGAAAAATLPSWIALAGAAAGAPRPQGGPVGKTERCLLLVVLAAVPGAAVPVLAAIAAGSVLTAGWRLVRVTRALRVLDQCAGRRDAGEQAARSAGTGHGGAA
ncbi:CDP-alcohol phosphatidyltransferase family protein [Murinocardiopsis flavida]|nr:CDP-alcohol phosphatidyltransferase family protein [Murinocardiopsis flavida]